MSTDKSPNTAEAGDAGETLSDANRRKINWLEGHFEDELEELEERIDDLEAENTKLRREIAELTDDGGAI